MSIYSFFSRNVNQLSQNVNEFILKHTENSLLNKIISECANGTFKSVVSSYVLLMDLPFGITQVPSTKEIISSLKVKKVHVINDKSFILKMLALQRNRINLSLESPLPGLGNQNMLTCPYAEHTRLRSPVEIFFKQKNIREKHFDIQALRLAEHIITIVNSAKVGEFNFSSCISLGITSDLMGFEASGYLVDLIEGFHLDEAWNQCIQHRIDQKNYEEGKVIDKLVQMKDKGKISEEELKDTILVLLLAGHHTTKKLVEFVTGELFYNVSIRGAIRKEWYDFLSNNQLNVEDVNSFIEYFRIFVNGGVIGSTKIEPSIWISATVIESLRLFPTIPIIKREVSQAFTQDNYKFKKGDIIDLNLLSAQRDKKEWDNPNDFNPSRHIKDGKIVKPRLLNFGTGPQACIGQDLAKQQIEITIGMVCLLLDDLRMDSYIVRVNRDARQVPRVDFTNVGLSHPKLLPSKHEVTGSEIAKSIFTKCQNNNSLTENHENAIKMELAHTFEYWPFTELEKKEYEKQFRMFASHIIAESDNQFENALWQINYRMREMYPSDRPDEVPSISISSFGVPPG